MMECVRRLIFKFGNVDIKSSGKTGRHQPRIRDARRSDWTTEGALEKGRLRNETRCSASHRVIGTHVLPLFQLLQPRPTSTRIRFNDSHYAVSDS